VQALLSEMVSSARTTWYLSQGEMIAQTNARKYLLSVAVWMIARLLADVDGQRSIRSPPMTSRSDVEWNGTLEGADQIYIQPVSLQISTAARKTKCVAPYT
jgi:hypothetical protein